MAREIIQSHGHTLDVLSNAEGSLQIQVSRRGAELVSLRKEGTGFLWRDGDVAPNPSGWNNHATVMGYYIHRLLNGVTTYWDRPVQGGTHSFLRHHEFATPEVGEDNLIYRFQAESLQPGQYPFLVDLTLTYALTDTALKVTFRFDNREETVSHVSFGLHPGFGVSSLATANVHLPAGTYRRHLAPGNFLSGEIEEFHFDGGLMPFSKEELPGSFLLELAGVPKRVFTIEDSPTRRRVTLDYQQAPYLTLWSDGGDFICVEPCWGLPDHHDQRTFANKEGMQTIWPRGHLERSFSITPDFSR